MQVDFLNDEQVDPQDDNEEEVKQSDGAVEIIEEDLIVVELYDEQEMAFEERDGDSMEFVSERKKWMANMTAKKNFAKENAPTGEMIKAMMEKQKTLQM